MKKERSRYSAINLDFRDPCKSDFFQSGRTHRTTFPDESPTHNVSLNGTRTRVSAKKRVGNEEYDSPDEVEGRDGRRGIPLRFQVTDLQKTPLSPSTLGSVFRIPGIERNGTICMTGCEDTQMRVIPLVKGNGRHTRQPCVRHARREIQPRNRSCVDGVQPQRVGGTCRDVTLISRS